MENGSGDCPAARHLPRMILQAQKPFQRFCELRWKDQGTRDGTKRKIQLRHLVWRPKFAAISVSTKRLTQQNSDTKTTAKRQTPQQNTAEAVKAEKKRRPKSKKRQRSGKGGKQEAGIQNHRRNSAAKSGKQKANKS